MNRYPSWVNWLVVAVMLFGILVASPNAFPVDPALQVSRTDGESVQEFLLQQARTTLDNSGIAYLSTEIKDGSGLIRLADETAQSTAQALLIEQLADHTVALTLAPRTPAFLQYLGLEPMNLGLDLRGGVHFLLQVDLDSAIDQFLGSYATTLREDFIDADIRNSVEVDGNQLVVTILNDEDLDAARDFIEDLDTGSTLTGIPRLAITETTSNGRSGFRVELSEALVIERETFAIQQNTTTLRNRVNEIGVSEPVVQRQGRDRILVQLPGVQDPTEAKRLLDATATLEYRLVDMENSAQEAERSGRAPLGSELFYDDDGIPILLRRDVIATGNQVIDAIPGYDGNGQPAVIVTLNGAGGDRMLQATQQNLGRQMAVLFIEEKLVVTEVNGEQQIDRTREERVINDATIQGVFSTNFNTTGLTPFEAQNLALLLRAGALATPVVIIQERTIGPSLGKENIDKGRLAILVGFALVVAFMIAYYRAFGLVANLALLANLVLMIAALSIFRAALTLPGIAGIVLTVGMAVDANVLIFERIREELRNGNSPQASIRAGYDKAFSTIADANVTTFIAAIVLFAYGTGPIQGFAVTLMIGIATSMFTAIVGTRAVINFIYGRRQNLQALSIGGRGSNATI
jgi:preprotein translocase subunit SecD